MKFKTHLGRGKEEQLDESLKSKLADLFAPKGTDLVKHALEGFDESAAEALKSVPADKKVKMKKFFDQLRPKLAKAKSLTEFERISNAELRKFMKG